MMDLLRRSNIEVHKVPCGEAPALIELRLYSQGASTHEVSVTDSSPDTDTSVVKVAMLSMKSQNWGKLCIPYGIVLCDDRLMTDIGSQFQGSPLAQSIDLSYASELHVPGSFPVPTIRGPTSALKSSLPADHGDSLSSTPQDLSRLKHATEYFLALAIQRH